MFKILRLVITVVSLSMPGTLLASTIEEKQRIVLSVYRAPGAEWAVLEQPFWKHHVVFRLVKSTDPKFAHRPKVAVDEQGKVDVLTDGVFKVSQGVILESFNHVAQSEAIQITPENIEDYARFFLKVHLLTYDSYYLVDKAMADKVLRLPQHSDEVQHLQVELEQQGKPHIDITTVDVGFRVAVFVWSSRESWVRQHDFTIHPDGTVALEGTKSHRSVEAGSTEQRAQ